VSLFCTLLGHKIPKGYYSYGEKYLDVQVFAIDGIDRIHARLTTECERCETKFDVGNIHLPLLSQYEANMLVRKER
jgi:hypothetical protein